MAKLVSVIACSHSPFLFQPVDWWNVTRDSRPAPADGKVDDDSQNAAKRARIEVAFDRLRDAFQAAKPDVVVVIGDDQEEQFSLSNFPAFAVYVGESFNGYRELAYLGTAAPGKSRPLKPKTPEHWTAVRGHPPLARAILSGMMTAGFDPAFMLSLPDENFGMGHAFMRPTTRLTGNRFDIPIVPVLVNCFYAPQPSAARCVAAARAIRRVIDTWPEDIRVAVVGSGGLWHTPGARDAYIDQDFDRAMLSYVESGDAEGMARYFDQWKPPAAIAGRRCYETFTGGTGMSGGIGNGVGEIRNWIMAAAIADRPGVVVDYIPVYASPCGMGFANWTFA